jgi:hypothetical protein
LIVPKENWHDQENCWVGENVKNNNTVIIGCSLEKPTDAQLTRFLAYVKKLIKQKTISNDCIDLHWGFKENRDSFECRDSMFNFKCESEKSILDNLINFQDYFFDIKSRAEKMDLPESDLKLKDVYVESSISVEDVDIEIGVESYLDKWIEEKNYRQITLLGEYGQGKSTCALMFTHHLISKESSLSSCRIPILIELRGKAPSTMSPDELLAAWAVNYRINPAALKKLIIDGRILLIFDGFDEMAFISEGETRVAHFRSIWQLAYSKNKILITGRPNFFLDDSEMKEALGMRESSIEMPYCDAVYLKPFSLAQMKGALRPFKESTQNEICHFAKQNSKFYDLASRACLLYIVGVLWERPSMEVLKDNLNSASIIDLFVKHSYERQEKKNRESNPFMTLNINERSFFMQGIASYMLSNDLPNQISHNELRSCVFALLKIIPASISSNVSAMDGTGLEPLRKRIGEDEIKLENLQTDIRTYGLIVNDPIKNGTFKFAHKSFMEFLSAKVITDSVTDLQNEGAKAICNSHELTIERLLWYPESFSFFTELLKTASKLKSDLDISNNQSLMKYLLKVLSSSTVMYYFIKFWGCHYISLKSRIILFRASKIKKILKTYDPDNSNDKEHYDEIKKFDAHINQSYRNIPILNSLSLFLYFAFFFLPYTYFSKLEKKIRIWENFCHELDIPSTEIAKFIGLSKQTNYFKFRRLQYMNNSKPEGINDELALYFLKSILILPSSSDNRK